MAFAPQVAGSLLAVVWGGAVLLWLALASMVSRALFRNRGFGLVRFSSGRWLLGVVSIESVAVLGTSVFGATHSATASMGALIAWALGLVAYPLVALVIALRLRRRGWLAMDLTPDHWILTGALAICTLAATDLATSPGGELIRDIRGSAIDFAWVTWSGAGALYVLLAAATFRRWIVCSAARRSDIRWWASVFPLGMYSACTFGLLSCEWTWSAAGTRSSDLLASTGCRVHRRLDEPPHGRSKSEGGARMNGISSETTHIAKTALATLHEARTTAETACQAYQMTLAQEQRPSARTDRVPMIVQGRPRAALEIAVAMLATCDAAAALALELRACFRRGKSGRRAYRCCRHDITQRRHRC